MRCPKCGRVQMDESEDRCAVCGEILKNGYPAAGTDHEESKDDEEKRRRDEEFFEEEDNYPW
jgi:hypothetical protein